MYLVNPGGNPMALVDDLLKGGNLVTGLVIGAAAVIVLPLTGSLVRPVAKTAIKGGILAYREATKLYEGAVGGIGDLAKEAMAAGRRCPDLPV
jgi:hypothetical protein